MGNILLEEKEFQLDGLENQNENSDTYFYKSILEVIGAENRLVCN